MPLPSPKKNEEQKPFISRCIGNPNVVEEFPDQKQRVAVCFSQWRKSKKDSVDETERTFEFKLDYSNNKNFRIDETTGFLHAKARLTRSGVFDYYDDVGNLYREYRPEEEVFDAASMNSLGLKPITNDHPDSLVTIDNVKHLQVGTVGEKIEKDNEFLVSSIVITDKDMVKTILNRKKSGLTTELSCGYSCKIIPDVGIHDKDGYYTFKQQKIRYNHVGIVDKGRAGKNVRILNDKKQNINNQHKEPKMPDKIQFTRKAVNINSLKMDAITEIVDTESLKLINALSSKLDEAIDVITSLSKDKNALQGKVDQASETVKTLQTKIDSLSDINSPVLSKMMKVRANIERVAAKLKVDCKDKDLKTVKIDCIKAASENANLDGKDDSYIDARFDSINEMLDAQEKSDGNDKFASFMKIAKDGGTNTPNDPRSNFINKDKESNRK